MNKRLLVFVYSSALLLLIGFSCKKKTSTPKFHFDYFPMEQGMYVIYDVTEIHHDNALDVHDTNRYLLKTLIGDTIIDNSGRIARIFERSIFDSLTSQFKPKDLWTCIIDQYRAELVEENQRIIKLVFAPTRYKEWDQNAFNMYPTTKAYYEEVHKPLNVGALAFDSTVRVEEDSVFNLVQYIRKYEVYAKGVGLVKKHFQELKIENFNKSNPITGIELFYTIIEHGKE